MASLHNARDVALRWGYTLVDLNEITRMSVHTIGPMGMDWQDRYDTAYSAVAEHLFAAIGPPSRPDLVRAGQLAIYDVVNGHLRHHGYYKAKTLRASAGHGSSPAFCRYWADWFRATPSCEQALVERLALYQILKALTPRQSEALAALGALDNYRAAAEALGLRPDNFRALIGRARGAFRQLWHEGEAPSKAWGTDRRVGRYEPHG